MVSWYWLIISAMLGAIIGLIVFALCVASKNPCSNCEVYINPDSDFRHCFDCEKVSK